MAADDPQQALGVLGLGDDLDAVLAQQRDDALAQQRLVLDDHDAHGSSALIGRPRARRARRPRGRRRAPRRAGAGRSARCRRRRRRPGRRRRPRHEQSRALELERHRGRAPPARAWRRSSAPRRRRSRRRSRPPAAGGGRSSASTVDRRWRRGRPAPRPRPPGRGRPAPAARSRARGRAARRSPRRPPSAPGARSSAASGRSARRSSARPSCMLRATSRACAPSCRSRSIRRSSAAWTSSAPLRVRVSSSTRGLELLLAPAGRRPRSPEVVDRAGEREQAQRPDRPEVPQPRHSQTQMTTAATIEHRRPPWIASAAVQALVAGERPARPRPGARSASVDGRTRPTSARSSRGPSAAQISVERIADRADGGLERTAGAPHSGAAPWPARAECPQLALLRLVVTTGDPIIPASRARRAPAARARMPRSPSSVTTAGQRQPAHDRRVEQHRHARPTPSCFISSSRSVAKTANTATITNAALVTVPPVAPTASAAASRGASARLRAPRGPARARGPCSPSRARTGSRTEQRQPVGDRAVRGEAEQRSPPRCAGTRPPARRTPRPPTAG